MSTCVNKKTKWNVNYGIYHLDADLGTELSFGCGRDEGERDPLVGKFAFIEFHATTKAINPVTREKECWFYDMDCTTLMPDTESKEEFLKRVFELHVEREELCRVRVSLNGYEGCDDGEVFASEYEKPTWSDVNFLIIHDMESGKEGDSWT